jgi:glucosamine 6-phosphate synthetase-like amidotransferase/phosphosugar isomerase protein
MCGIGGWIRGDSHRMDPDAIATLWTALEERGRHAAGIGWSWTDADRPCIYKAPRKASSLVDSGVLDKVGTMVDYLLLHTRYSTHGSTTYNGNNHPVQGHGFIVTHNGVLQNDDETFQTLDVNRLHQVDSEAINATLRYSGVESVADELEGSISIAWVDETDSTTVHLFTNGLNPLVIGRTVDGDIVWASGLHHLEQAFEMASYFHAEPFKHYWVDTTQEILTIRSEWVSTQRTTPTILRSLGGYGGERGHATTPKRTERASDDPAIALEAGGWVKDSTGKWTHPIYSP